MGGGALRLRIWNPGKSQIYGKTTYVRRVPPTRHIAFPSIGGRLLAPLYVRIPLIADSCKQPFTDRSWRTFATDPVNFFASYWTIEKDIPCS